MKHLPPSLLLNFVEVTTPLPVPFCVAALANAIYFRNINGVVMSTEYVLFILMSSWIVNGDISYGRK